MLMTDLAKQMVGDHAVEHGSEMFERKSFSTANGRARRIRTLAELIDSARPPENLIRSPKSRLWLAEATNRSCNLLQLFLALEVNTWQENTPSLRSQLDCALATSLCASFRSLDHCTGYQAVECSDVFRGVVGGIVTLFERTVGTLDLHMKVDRLALASDKRRALVLCASELLLTAIRCGFRSPAAGTISIMLKATSGSQATLTVCITGSHVELNEENKSLAIVGGLAGMLDGEVILRRSQSGMYVEIAFPHL
jgi:hypothetical protein